MKAAISGSTGFIGSHLKSALLAKGWTLFEIGRGESTDSLVQKMSEFKPDVVFHLASLFIAEHRAEDIEGLVQSNILLGAQILEAMNQAGCKNLVNTGTVWQNWQGHYNIPTNFYAATKTALEEIIKFYVSAKGLRCINLKLGDSYGPNDKRGKLVSKLIESLGTSQSFELSPGEQQIDLVHVNDIVEGFLVAANKVQEARSQDGWMKSFSLSSTEALSLKQLVQQIEKLANKKIAIRFGARPYREREVMKPDVMDPLLPGWTRKISIENGLKELIHGA